MENLQNTWHTGENLTNNMGTVFFEKNTVPNLNIPVPNSISPVPFRKGVGNIPRRGRKESKTSIYHVVSRGINKEAIFKEQRERSRMLNLIRENLEEYDVEIYAYCIMPNHFHLLIKADLKELASFIAIILAKFAKYYNQKHNRVGHVFQGRYKSQCVEDINYFWNCLRYIHKNPLYLEENENIIEYKYSSMGELYYSKKDILADIIFSLVGEKFKDSHSFYEFHKIGSWYVFEDIAEEAKDNKMRIAKEVLEEYAAEYETQEIEIIDYVESREQLKESLITIMNVSVHEAEGIISELKKQIEGTG